MTLNEILRACFILFTPLLLILHTCSVRLSHGWIYKRILNQGASSPAVLLFFRDNAPAPHESTGSFVFFLWTLHQPLGPRLPQTSNTVYANSLPEAALTVWVKDQMHLKLSAFLTRGQNGPLNGHMAAADWPFGGQFWEGGWICFGFSCCTSHVFFSRKKKKFHQIFTAN